MHKKLPKIYHYIDKFNYNYIKALHKDIALIFRNYHKKIEAMKINPAKMNPTTNAIPPAARPGPKYAFAVVGKNNIISSIFSILYSLAYRQYYHNLHFLNI